MIKKAVYTLFIIVFTLVILEIFLGVTHLVSKGQLYFFENFTEIDSLEVFPFYATDASGIIKLDSNVCDTLRSYHVKNELSLLNDRYMIDDLLLILEQFDDLRKIIVADSLNALSSNEFSNFALNSLQKDGLDSNLISQYISFPFNRDGFRSIDFYTQPSSSKKKIMLVGDSFVWGMSAHPYYNSFADILLARNYLVYNLGIIGTDPAQYLAIVEKYAPIIQPDLIIINFFEGNDYMSFPRQVKANQPLDHFTNVGFIESSPLGEYLNPQEAFDFYKEASAIPNLESNSFNRFCAKSNVGTLLWRVLYAIKITKHEKQTNYFNGLNKPRAEKAVISHTYLKNINDYLTENDFKGVFTFIPEKSSTSNSRLVNSFLNNGDYEKAKAIAFNNIEYYCPSNLLEADYEEAGGSHFINTGSLKYANFLDSLIQAKLE